mgnify:CR=1 FL=1
MNRNHLVWGFTLSFLIDIVIGYILRKQGLGEMDQSVLGTFTLPGDYPFELT